jgi:NAD(P)H dehydrogenase (quinone)
VINIVVVYHDENGCTHKQAETVVQGLEEDSDVEVFLLSIDDEGGLPEGGWDLLSRADTIIFGSPSYGGKVSWQFKAFAGGTKRYLFEQEWKDKLVAGFTHVLTAEDASQAVFHEMFTLGVLHSMIWISPKLESSIQDLALESDVTDFNSCIGLMTQFDTDINLEESNSIKSPQIGKGFGRRISKISRYWVSQNFGMRGTFIMPMM